MITLYLTPAEARKLEMYLRLTTKYRKGEADTHNNLFNSMCSSGTADEQVLKTMKDNAEYWKEQCEVMDSIQERIFAALTTPPPGGDRHDN